MCNNMIYSLKAFGLKKIMDPIGGREWPGNAQGIKTAQKQGLRYTSNDIQAGEQILQCQQMLPCQCS